MTAPSHLSPTLVNNNRTAYVYGLDIIRFIAAALVIFYHLGFKAWALNFSSLNPVLGKIVSFPPGYFISSMGWVGVQIFFVVSGAVIANSAQNGNAFHFGKRRILRLLPNVLIAVAIAIPVAITVFKTPIEMALLLGLKTVGFVPVGPWIIGQFWTIPMELSFYVLVWGLLIIGLPRGGMNALAWTLGLTSSAYWFAVLAEWIPVGGRLSELLLLQHGIYFAIGMLCSRLAEKASERADHLSIFHGFLAALCLVAAIIQIQTAAHWEIRGESNLSDNWWVAYCIWLFMTGTIALSFLYLDRIAVHAAPFKTFCRTLGLSTFPLYLIHMHVGGAVLVVAAPLGIVPAFLGACAVSMAVALIIVFWLEQRLYDMIDKLFARFAQVTWMLPKQRFG